MSVLEVSNLECCYHTDNGVVKAIDGISFGLEAGEIIGVIGESGSGKTTLALSIMRLGLSACSYNGTAIRCLPEPEVNRFGGRCRYRGNA